MIKDSGQLDFYRFRTQTNAKAEEILPQELLEIEALDNTDIASELLHQEDNLNVIELGIEGITCAACGWLIKKQIGARPEVHSIEVNATTHRAILKFDQTAPLSQILKQIRQLGYKAFPFTEDQQEESFQNEDKAFSRRLIVAGLAMMQVMMFATGLYIGDFQDISEQHALFLHSVSGLLATPVVLYSALPFFKSAWRSLQYGHFGMNLPVSIAILAAYFSSIYSLIFGGSVFYFDSVVMFTFFLLLGRYLEHRVKYKAILKQQNFKRLLPVSVSRFNSDGEIEVVSLNQIKIDDRILVNAGSVVPVDGKLLSGQAELNESVITGEFLPVSKQKEDSIFSGSSNASASFEMVATSDVKNSRLQNLIQLQQNSENLESHRVTLADRIASYYVIGLLALSILAGVIWYIIDPSRVFEIVLSLLVVSCPCALSLATPAAVASAIAKLTDLGLMIKSSNTLGKLSQIKTAIFDKTGTLTFARMAIHQVKTRESFDAQKALQLAIEMERVSNHPIAQAFSDYATKYDLVCDNHFEELQERIAGGVTAKSGNDQYRLGNLQFVSSLPELTTKKQIAELSSEQETIDYPAGVSVFLSLNENIIAEFFLSDLVNESAEPSISQLNQLGVDSEMLSGDSLSACHQVAKLIGISDIVSHASPEKKLEHIKSLNQQGLTTLMIGDGVNDIGAFAEADVSITMGEASHLSKTSSDAVLVSKDLSVIPKAIQLTQQLDKIIKQNLTWAVVYNLTAIPFALLGLVPAWLAAIGMTSSSLIVVLNALRLRN